MAMGCAAATAHAQSWFQFETGIGGSIYRSGPDGLWRQDGFPHSQKFTAPSFELGFTGDLYRASHWGVSWHADWAWLGSINMQSMATPSDANYNLVTKGCNGPCWPLSHFAGSGHDQGFLLTIEPHIDYGGWRFGVEAGPYIHRATWTETVTGWEGSPNGPRSDFTVAYSGKWQLGAIVGASVGRGPFTLTYQYFANKTPGNADVPAPWGGVHMLMVKYRANLL